MSWVRAIALGALLLPLCAGAVQISMDVQPRALTLGETTTLTISMEGTGQAGAPNLPDLDGFQVVGRNSGTSVTFDGQTQRTTVNHQYILQPVRMGTIRVGPFSYDLNGQTYDLPAVEVQVLAASAAAGGGGGKISDLLFATLTAEPTNVYHQQTFDLVLSIYSRGLNLDSRVEANFNTTGLKVGQLNEVQAGREVINNQPYDVRRWRGKATALTAGAFHLKPSVRVGLISENQRRRDPFDMFGDFFGRREVRPTPVEVKTLDLEVKALPPEGRPAEFAGAVGRFTFDVNVLPIDVAAGEPVTVTMSLSGQGNIAMVAPPTLAVDEQFRSYDTKLVTDEVDNAQASGRKVFEQVLIPRSGSATNLPAVAFAFFNPENGRYETLRRGPFTLHVRASSNEASRIVQAANPDATPAERVLLGTDIGYLKPGPATWTRDWQPAWITRTLFLGAQAVPPIALGLVLLFVRRRDSLAKDVRKARRAQAPKSARAALADAEAALQKSDAAAYHDAVWRALTSYFANRLNLQPGEATRDVVLARLIQTPAGREQEAAVRNAFLRCEEARFGAGGRQVDAAAERSHLEELTRVLRACEEIAL